ncbi:T-cell ecto-ADP-ribosyltransferase 2-like [Hipposideros larvatus]
MASLLAIAVHLLILTQWLTQQVTGQDCPNNPFELDMAANAFDDQYEGCTEEMDKKAPKLLIEELEMNKKFKEQWKRAKQKWEQIKNNSYPKHFNDFHGTAVVAYTGDIHAEFNKAIREFNQTSHNFQFKAFHYYLTRALQLLTTGTNYTVYRGCPNKVFYSGTGNVRFGQFASTSTTVDEALHFAGETGTLFTIRTHLGVDIQAFSLYPHENEVLIPGYEMYQKVIKQKPVEKYDKILLESPTKSKSNINCFYSSTINLSNFNSSGMTGSPAFLLLLPGLLVLLFLPAEL